MGFCFQDGKVEGHALIFSCWELQNYNSLMNNHQQENVGSHQKKIPMSKVKEEPQQDSSVQFSHSVMSDSLQPHESQHARPPRPSPTAGVHSDSRPSSHLILCRPLLLPPSIFPSTRIFPMSQFFTSSGQRIGVSASTSVLPMNTQDWSPLGWTGWISLQSKGLSRVFSNTTLQKH